MVFKTIKKVKDGFETIFGNWKSFEIMQNAFYFTSNALFVLKIFKICPDFLVI